MRPANIFFDTEFSDFFAPELLSIGFISEGGRTCHIEIDDVDPKSCSQFVREVVLPLLTESKVSYEEAGKRVKDYLVSFGVAIDLWTDAANFDAVLLSELVDSVRSELPEIRICNPEFTPGITSIVFAAALEKSYEGGALRRHHALDDAKALRQAWLAVYRAKPRAVTGAAAEALPLPDRAKRRSQ